MQDLLSKISALEIENKDNAETLQSKIQRKEESRKQIMCVQGEHAALVLGIQQERDGKEISLKAAHSEELKCAKLQAENEMREKIMEVRTEHEVQMKALTCQHEDECRKLQEELDLQKSRKLGKLPRLGIFPVKKLYESSTSERFEALEIVMGISPLKRFV
uniref:Uncharacterized protein n=1 Tax=Salix viminalis TaxID=40686 RepID=A0A6N2KK29_SALVM